MGNSFVSSLPTLDPSSVENVSSLFFYLSNNGTNGLYSGKTLESYLGYANSTILLLTGVQTVVNDTTVPVQWDTEIQDPLNMWDAASNTLIAPNFTGWVQFRARIESNTGGGTYTRCAVRKNGSGGEPGTCYWGYRDYVTGYRDSGISAPMSCSPGDTFDLRAYYQQTCQIGDSKTWLECIPLKIYI